MKKITSFGEILFDVYPEKKTLGGAPFNFIYHIIKLTGQGNFVSRVGKDDPGNEIFAFLKSKGIAPGFIQIDEKHPTGMANANLDENKIPHWVIEPDCAYDFIEETGELINLINNNTDCLYFGTLAQRGEESRKTLSTLFGSNVKYFCDLNLRQNFYNKDILKTSLKTADVLKLNNDELKTLNNLLLKTDMDEFELIKKLSEIYNIKLVCLTKGDKGAVIYKNGDISSYKYNTKNVVDTVGAGDAYAAVLCIGYLEDWNIEKTNKTASEFAAEIVQVEGALPKDENIYNQFKNKLRNG